MKIHLCTCCLKRYLFFYVKNWHVISNSHGNRLMACLMSITYWMIESFIPNQPATFDFVKRKWEIIQKGFTTFHFFSPCFIIKHRSLYVFALPLEAKVLSLSPLSSFIYREMGRKANKYAGINHHARLRINKKKYSSEEMVKIFIFNIWNTRYSLKKKKKFQSTRETMLDGVFGSP